MLALSVEGVTARIARWPVWQRVALVAALLWLVYFAVLMLSDRRFALSDTRQVFTPAVGVGPVFFFTAMRQTKAAAWFLAPVAMSAELLVPALTERPWPSLVLASTSHVLAMTGNALLLLALDRRVSLAGMPVATIGSVSLSAATAEVRGVLTDLRTLGVRIAVDDFGSGFSGLAYLTQLPIDIVKFDRQFLKACDDPRARGLLVSAAGLAK